MTVHGGTMPALEGKAALLIFVLTSWVAALSRAPIPYLADSAIGTHSEELRGRTVLVPGRREKLGSSITIDSLTVKSSTKAYTQNRVLMGDGSVIHPSHISVEGNSLLVDGRVIPLKDIRALFLRAPFSWARWWDLTWSLGLRAAAIGAGFDVYDYVDSRNTELDGVISWGAIGLLAGALVGCFQHDSFAIILPSVDSVQVEGE